MRAPTALLLALTVAAAAPAGAADLVEIYRAGANLRRGLRGRARDLGGGPGEAAAGPLRAAALGHAVGQHAEERPRPAVPRRDRSRAVEHRFNSNALTLSVTQPLFRRQNVVVYEQAKSQVAQADAVFALAAQDLILRVAQAYFDVLLAQNTVEFAAAQIVAIGQQLEQAKRNFEVGTATITDTHDAQARYDLTRVGRDRRAGTTWRSRSARSPRSSGAPRRRCSRSGRAHAGGPAAEQHGGVGERSARVQPADRR